VNKELARDLISAGVHFGHAVSRWNPGMRPYIFAKRGMIHIINVRETLKGVILAKKLLSDIVSGGKDVVFVGTKRQAQKAVQKAAETSGMHYVCQRWLGGTLTNFRTIRSRLQRLEELEALEAGGQLDSESKKQASRHKRELKKIYTNLNGVRKLSRIPGAIVVVDAKKEHIALREAQKLGIATICIIDTDSDPKNVDVPIPANDDSLKAIELIMNELAQAVAEGKTRVRPEESAAPARPVRAHSRRRILASAVPDQGQPQVQPTEDVLSPQVSEPAGAENATLQ